MGDVRRVEVRRLRGRPESESVMVLGGQHHVLCAGAAEEVRPCRRVEVLGLEVRREVVVRLVRIVLLVVRNGLRSVLPTLGVCVMLRIAVVNAVLAAGRERRDGVNAPVDEYAELGVLEPFGAFVPAEGFPGRLVRCRRDGAGDERDGGAGRGGLPSRGDARTRPPADSVFSPHPGGMSGLQGLKAVGVEGAGIVMGVGIKNHLPHLSALS